MSDELSNIDDADLLEDVADIDSRRVGPTESLEEFLQLIESDLASRP